MKQNDIVYNREMVSNVAILDLFNGYFWVSLFFFFLETDSAHEILCEVCDAFLASEWPCMVKIIMNQPLVHEEVERYP